MNHVLAFDFDGVLSDSLLEAYLITWRISGRFDPALTPPAATLPSLAAIHAFREQHQEHWRAFNKLVPLGNRAEDYLVIHSAVARSLRLKTQSEFNEFKAGMERSRLEEFHEEFYRERYSLAGQDHERWLALNEPYPGAREAVRALAARFKLAVATSKDARTVRELLDNWGLSGLFLPEAVLDKTAGESKRAHLSALKKIFACDFSRITFIDDKVSHLLDCLDLGVRLYLAGWGYNGETEWELARRHAIPVLTLEKLSLLSPDNK